MTVRISTLPNGLRIATDSMADAESVVMGAWVGVGTRHEPRSANGVAHLVEHMMFKGTKRRSAFALSTEIEKNGGQINAFTTREETAYCARVLPEDTELACDIVADMLQNSVMSEKELKRERQVIIQEIGRDRDAPEDFIFELLHQTAFPRQRIGRPILGVEKVIATLPRKAVQDYVKNYYHTGNMIIIGAGRIDHEKFVRTVAARFGRLPKGKRAKSEAARAKGGELRVKRDIEQAHVILAFPSPSVRSKDAAAAQLLAVLLGGSASSRLFHKVREQRGLVYSVHANQIAYADTGLFEIYAGTDPARVKELMPVIWNELKDVQRNIGPAEFKRAKAQMRADLLMGQENVMRRAETLGFQMTLFGKPISVKDRLEKVMGITVKDVQALAKRIFGSKEIFVLTGPQ